MKKIMLSKIKPDKASFELQKIQNCNSMDSDAKDELDNFLWSEWCKDQGPSDVNVVNFLKKRSIGVLNEKKAAVKPKLKEKNMLLTDSNEEDTLSNIETLQINGDSTTASIANTFEENDLAKNMLVYKKCSGIGNLSKSCFYIAVSNDGKYMAACHGDHTVKIIDVKMGCQVQQLIGFNRTPWSVAFHPTKSEIIAVGCRFGEVRIFYEGMEINMWHSPMNSTILSMSFHPTEPILALASASGLFFWHNCDSSLQISAIFSSTVGEHIRYVRFSPCGQFLLTAIRNPSCLNMGDPEFHSSIKCSNVEENYSHHLYITGEDDQLPPNTPNGSKMTLSEVREFNSRLEVAPTSNGSNRISGYPDEVLPFNSMNFLCHHIEAIKSRGFFDFKKVLDLMRADFKKHTHTFFNNIVSVDQALDRKTKARNVILENFNILNRLNSRPVMETRTINEMSHQLQEYNMVDDFEEPLGKCRNDLLFALYREIYPFFPKRTIHQFNLLLNLKEFWLNKAHQLAVQEYTRGTSFMNNETGISYEHLCALDEHRTLIWNTDPNADHILSSYVYNLIENRNILNFRKHRSDNISKPINLLLPLLNCEYKSSSSEPRGILFESYNDCNYTRAIPTALKLAFGANAPSLIVRNRNNISETNNQTLSKLLDSVDTSPEFSAKVQPKFESKASNNSYSIALDSLSPSVLQHITDFTTFSSHVGCIVKHNMVQNRHQSFDSYKLSGKDFSSLVNTETLSLLTATIKEQSDYYFMESSEESINKKRKKYSKLFSEANVEEMEIIISGLVHSSTGLNLKTCEDLFWLCSINRYNEDRYHYEEYEVVNEVRQCDGIPSVMSEAIVSSRYLIDLIDLMEQIPFHHVDDMKCVTFIYEFQRLVLKHFTFRTFVCLFYNDPLSIFAWLGVETENYYKRLLGDDVFDYKFPQLPRKNLISAETLLSSVFGASVPKFTHCGIISRFIFGATMEYRELKWINSIMNENGLVDVTDHKFYLTFNMFSEVHDACDVINRVMDSVKTLQDREIEIIHNMQALDMYIAVVQSISIEAMNRITELHSRNIILNHAKEFKVHNIIVPDTLPDHFFFKICHYIPDPSSIHENLVIEIKPIYSSRSTDITQMEKAIFKYQVYGPSSYNPELEEKQTFDELKIRVKSFRQKLAVEPVTDNELADFVASDFTYEPDGKYKKIKKLKITSSDFIALLFQNLETTTKNVAMLCEFLNWDILSPFYRLFGPRAKRPVALDVRGKWIHSLAYLSDKRNTYRTRPLIDLPYKEDSVPGKFRNRRMAFTARVQLWKFDSKKLPNITDRTHNVVAPCIFINNDSCLSISEDWKKIAVLMPVFSGDGFRNSCGVFSLLSGYRDREEVPRSLGVPLYSARVHDCTISIAFNHNGNKLVLGRANINITTTYNVDVDSHFNDQEYDIRYHQDDSIAHIVKLGDAGNLSIIRSISKFFSNALGHSASLNSLTWLRKPPYSIVVGTNTGAMYFVESHQNQTDYLSSD